jgi:hypothetical protein
MRGLIKYTNKLQEFLLKMMPYFKGSWIIYANLFRLLPTSLRYIKLEDLSLVVPPDHSQALAQAMRVFIQCASQKRTAWRANGLALVQTNSWGIPAQKFVQLYKRVTA